MRVLPHVSRTIHRRPRQPTLLRRLEEVRFCETARERLDHVEDMLLLRQTDFFVVPARITEIRGLRGFLHPPDERRPHARVAAEAAGDEAVARPEVPVRDVRMATAAPAWNDAGVDERDRAVLERGCDRLLDRDLDVLAASGPSPDVERRQRSDSGLRAREVIRLLA